MCIYNEDPIFTFWGEEDDKAINREIPCIFELEIYYLVSNKPHRKTGQNVSNKWSPKSSDQDVISVSAVSGSKTRYYAKHTHVPIRFLI